MTCRTMRAVWLEGGAVRVREDVPVPDPPPGEALVRVRLAGICNTDLELIRGYYPFTGVLGHEFVGVVERVESPGLAGQVEPATGDAHGAAGSGGARPGDGEGAVRPGDGEGAVRPGDGEGAVRPGDGEGAARLIGHRVVGEINAVCGACAHCLAGRPTHCARRTVLGIVGRHGAFAEYLTLPVGNLHPVPDGVPDEAALFTEPLAAALEIQEQVEVGPEDRVLVVGDGKLGQLIARTLGLVGCELTVLGRHERKLGLLAELGIDTVGAATGAALPRELEPGSFDLAVECTGSPSGFETARAALRPRGTLVLKSTYAGKLSLDASSLVVDEITLVGSRCGPFEPALRLLERGRIDPRELIDDRFPLSGAETALERARERDVLKVLLEIP